MTTLGLPFRVAAVDVDESGREREGPRAYLDRIVNAKLDAAMALPEAGESGAVLVADTAVILDGSALGKPRDEADARSMLRALSGRDHHVWTRFAIAATLHTPRAETTSTRVVFRALTDDEIEGYVATGEGLDKAGAYAIQGIGSFAVERIEGSWSNVVGLPACEVIQMLQAMKLLDKFPLASGST